MATYNVELRQRISGTFGDTIYLKANWNNLDNKPSTFTPTAHTHGNVSNDGKIGSTAGLIIKTGTSGLLEALAAGSSGQFLGHDGTWKNLPAISLTAGYGDSINPYASKTAKYFLAAPNGAAGAPTFRAIVASDIPTLNQNTTGSAAKLTTTRALSIGGTAKNFDGSAAVTWTNAEIGINVVTTCPVSAGTAGKVNIYTGAACATKYANWLYFETT